MRDTEFDRAMDQAVAERDAARSGLAVENLYESELSMAQCAAKRAVSPIAYFDPDRLWDELERNLPAALRGLADALEARAMDGRLAGFHPHGLTGGRAGAMERAHVFVRLELSAPVRRALVAGACKAVAE